MSTSIQMLCLTCSASLPPRRKQESGRFTTRCCAREICPRCLFANPRLSRYHPCLACLAGVSAVASSSSQSTSRGASGSSCRGSLWTNLRPQDDPLRTKDQLEHVGYDNSDEDGINVDGSLRDGDLFIVGDDDDDEVGRGRDERGTPPPAYSESSHAAGPSSPSSRTSSSVPRSPSHNELVVNDSDDNTSHHATPGNTIVIDKSDTLLGIALKYGVDVRAHRLRLSPCPRILPSVFQFPHKRLAFPSAIRLFVLHRPRP